MHNIPNTYFRISIKAIIRNEKDEVLCVKEAGSSWTLPGGGLDHGEDIKAGFARELHEEILLIGDFDMTFVDLKQMWMPVKKAWQMWLVFEVVPENMEFGLGVDADEWGFLDPARFKDSSSRTERWIYEYGHLKQFNMETSHEE